MFIMVKHSKFDRVELRDNSLLIHSMQGQMRVLQEDVTEVAVVVLGELVHILAFSDQPYVWHFSGSDELKSQRVDFEQPHIKFGKLVGDDDGNLHLFYFAKQMPGGSLHLKHRIFSNSWGDSQTVSINVFGGENSLSASWHHDGYLHVVYLDQKDKHLYYRVFISKEKVWSGAVGFAREKCNFPQLISVSGKLYLFWQEEREKVNLQVRSKNRNWSDAIQISSGQSHVSNVGYACNNEFGEVYWSEAGELYFAPFDNWSDRRLSKRADFDYVWKTINLSTIATYEPKIEAEITPALRIEKVESQEEVEDKLQKTFMAQAFRILQEWDDIKKQVYEWQKDLRLPKSIDLNPLIVRIERLERKIVSLQQAVEKKGEAWEQNQVYLNRRLHDLENPKKDQQITFWQRLLRK